MDSNKIGAFLKELRKSKGLTQEQFAEIFQVSGRTVSRWETGKNLPDLGILIQIAEYYEIDLKELLDGGKDGENMDQKQKETLLKVAEYTELEKKMATKASVIAFMLMFSACAALIIVQIMLTMNLRYVVGETIVMLLGGCAYIGILVHNGVWKIASPWKNTWKSDLAVSVCCAFVFAMAFSGFLRRAEVSLGVRMQRMLFFWAVMVVISFALLRVLAFINNRRREKREK